MTGTKFGGDRPIHTGYDKLGFEEAAQHVATAILKFASTEGFVLGLEGVWGSGKSSFANLIVDALARGAPKPEVIRFSPWLISSRNGMLDELFREIAVAAERIGSAEQSEKGSNPFQRAIAGYRSRAMRRRLKERLQRFSSQLSRLGPLANLASAFVPGIGTAGGTIGQVQGAADSWATGASLEDEKQKLIDELRKLGRQIVIFVDDLDRLEPREAAEVVRLVRAVADFPNVVYVLCYAPEILAKSLQAALGIENGANFIEKIVQVTFGVPKPEDFDLRRMFREELFSVFPQDVVDESGTEALSLRNRLSSVIDIEGGRTLRTPRDVVRVLNALRLYAGPIYQKIDQADMVWLQLIRLRNASLYHWIETYIYNVATVAAGAHVAESDAADMAATLSKILTADGGDVRRRIIELQQLLPGIDRALPVGNGEAQFTLFHNVGRTNALASYIATKRLGSPQHYRFYFSLSKPSGALEDDEYKGFIAAAEHDLQRASQQFLSMAIKLRPQGGSVVEGILDRVNADAATSVPAAAIPGIILSLADGMDDAARTSGQGEWGRYWVWSPADRALRAALARLDSAERDRVVRLAFENGRALGWLSSVMRDEIFAHGRYGDKTREPEARTLTEGELDAVISILRKRYQESAPETLMDTPDFLSLLFGWKQSGPDGANELQNWIASIVSTDDGLLAFLDRCRSWSSTNGQVTYPIRRDNLSHLIDFEQAFKRMEALTSSDDARIRSQASSILNAMKQRE